MQAVLFPTAVVELPYDLLLLKRVQHLPNVLGVQIDDVDDVLRVDGVDVGGEVEQDFLRVVLTRRDLVARRAWTRLRGAVRPAHARLRPRPFCSSSSTDRQASSTSVHT